MESSPFLHPTFLLTAGTVIIGFVVWLVRLEGKATMATESHAKADAERSEIWREVERHKENADIHFNQKVSAEIEKGNARRFDTIERQLGEINHKLDRLSSKE